MIIIAIKLRNQMYVPFCNVRPQLILMKSKLLYTCVTINSRKIYRFETTILLSLLVMILKITSSNGLSSLVDFSLCQRKEKWVLVYGLKKLEKKTLSILIFWRDFENVRYSTIFVEKISLIAF